ncbi:hypothetical protein BDW02DRAFT_566894 [Decorospora gaudefroyi]|uniref:Uncharacterized protein n=1 Tax=Decorospora gaudefroyi TaxID=184978 RepID=A0A6A5KEN2_9PLEO|nr:hypothetical protein BDW02DRAFT_566894 [Decorospora gaudefroyi]
MFDDPDNVSPRALPQDKTKPYPSEPPSKHNHAARRDSPVLAFGPVDFSGLDQTRKDSDGTVFPCYPSSIKKPDTKAKNAPSRKQSPNTDPNTRGAAFQRHANREAQIDTGSAWYRAGRHIYNAGPKGEGQKLWKAYQQIRNANHNDISFQRMKENPLPPAPPHISDHPAPRPRPTLARFVDKGKSKATEPESSYPRKDSVFSQSSYEVPVAIDKSLQRIVDTNKPLPHVPQLDPAPRARRQVGQDRDLSRRPPKIRPSGPTPHTGATPRPEKETHLNPWWKPVVNKPRPSLKAKISHPGPLMASNYGATANIAAECGGVGGPAAAVSLPVTRTGGAIPQAGQKNMYAATKEPKRPLPLNLEPEQKNGKQQQKEAIREDTPPTHWRSKFVGPVFQAVKHTALDGVHRKRRSSDASFACKGVGDEDMLDRYQVEDGEESGWPMMPEPLFSNDRMEGRGKRRDTRFYEAYVEVLDEY